MKRFVTIFVLILAMACLSAQNVMAQTARQVLDKCAAAVSNKNGVTADFKAQNNLGTLSGSIAVKGDRFHASTSHGLMWFDGKTQWTYLKKNNEVTVVHPSEAELQSINPYNIINNYKKGYKYTMNSTAQSYTVHLTATDSKRTVSEMFITVDKKSYAPTQVKMLDGKRWSTFTISNLRQANLPDSEFQFNSKDFPTAEVIDLR